MRRLAAGLAGAAGLLAATPVWCESPPYDTPEASIADRPELVAMAAVNHSDFGDNASIVLDLTIPLERHWQLTLTPSFTSAVRRGARRAGPGDTEVGVTVVGLEETGTRPAVAFETTLSLPTGSRRDGLGEGVFQGVFSAVASKGWGLYRLTAQIAYAHAGQDDLAPVSLLLERSVGARWRFGAEVVSQQPLRRRCARRGQLDAGAAFELRDGITLHAVIGRSLGEGGGGFARFALALEF